MSESQPTFTEILTIAQLAAQGLCLVCGWTIGSDGGGCTHSRCSFIPGEYSDERRRIVRHREVLGWLRSPASPAAALVSGSDVGMRLYRVDDDDGEMFVVARDFSDAIARWRHQLSAENPESDFSELGPTSVALICAGGDLLLPRVAEQEDSDV